MITGIALIGLLVVGWLLMLCGMLPTLTIIALSVCLIVALVCVSLEPLFRQLIGTWLRQYRKIWIPALLLTTAASVGTYLCDREFENFPFMFFLMAEFLLFVLIVIFVTAWNSQSFAEILGNALGNWIRAGGCWKINSTNNIPANSILTILLIWTILAVAYGPSTSKLETWYQNSKLVQESVQSVKESVNYLTETLVGKAVFEAPADPQNQKPVWVKSLPMRFVSVFFLPFGLLVYILSRRDGVAEALERLVNSFKRNRDRVTTSSKGPEAEVKPVDKPAEHTAEVTPEKPDKKGWAKGDTPFSKLLASDLISDFIMEFLPFLITLLRKKHI